MARNTLLPDESGNYHGWLNPITGQAEPLVRQLSAGLPILRALGDTIMKSSIHVDASTKRMGLNLASLHLANGIVNAENWQDVRGVLMTFSSNVTNFDIGRSHQQSVIQLQPYGHRPAGEAKINKHFDNVRLSIHPVETNGGVAYLADASFLDAGDRRWYGFAESQTMDQPTGYERIGNCAISLFSHMLKNFPES